MRPERRILGYALVAAAAASTAGCGRMTFMKPDPRRGGFRQTSHQVEIREDARARSDVLLLVQTAHARLASGDPAAALMAADKALALDERHAGAHSLRALGLDALGRTRDAGPHHRRAAELAPADGSMLNNYGAWLCANGHPAPSLAWFERAAASPGYATPDAALANAGICALEGGDVEQAAQRLREAIALSPANAAALQALARLEFGRGRTLEARAFIERRLAAAPADPESLLLASQIEQKLGDTAAATRYVHRMRAEFPRSSSSAPEGGNR